MLVASSSVLDVCRSGERSTSDEDALGTGVCGSGIEGGPLRLGVIGGLLLDFLRGELTFSEDWTDLEGCRWRDGGSLFFPSAVAQEDSRIPEGPGVSS
jgi:hypothetical protein